MDQPNVLILTHTFNRRHLLERAYRSLLNQSDKEFTWLVIDDGSSDETDMMVRDWATDGRIRIKYVRKNNGGKFSTLLFAKKYMQSGWVIILDNHDELAPAAVQVFREEIIKLHAENSEIRQISAFSVLPNGEPQGKFHFPEGTTSQDLTWHDMVLSKKNDDMMISCIRMDAYKSAVSLPHSFWLENKINQFNESVFWARISGKIRFINEGLKIHHTDTIISTAWRTDPETGYYEDLLYAKFFLSENMHYFFRRPSYFISLLFKYHLAGKVCRIAPYRLLGEAEGVLFEMAYIASFLPAQMLNWYYKLITKRLWRGPYVQLPRQAGGFVPMIPQLKQA